jgi:hypothetical protein
MDDGWLIFDKIGVPYQNVAEGVSRQLKNRRHRPPALPGRGAGWLAVFSLWGVKICGRRAGDTVEKPPRWTTGGRLAAISHTLRSKKRSRERKTISLMGASLATETVPGSAGDLVAGSFSEASCSALIGWSPQGQGGPQTRGGGSLRERPICQSAAGLITCPTSGSELVRRGEFLGECERCTHECAA